MTTNSNVAVVSDGFLPSDKIDLLKRTIAKGATNDEFALFLAQVERMRLDPFAGQIFAVKRDVWDPETRTKKPQMSIQVGVAGLELIAQRTGEFQGFDGPYWCGPDGQWTDVWLSTDPPAAAKVGVYRQGFVKPLYGIALWREYVQNKANGEPAALWKSKPTIMIAKCAESLALRKAFQAEIGNIYTTEEMGTRSGSIIQIEGSDDVIEGEAYVIPDDVPGSTAPASPAPQPTDGNDPVTEDIVQKLTAKAYERGFDEHDLWWYCHFTFQVDGVDQLTKSQSRRLYSTIDKSTDEVIDASLQDIRRKANEELNRQAEASS